MFAHYIFIFGYVLIFWSSMHMFPCFNLGWVQKKKKKAIAENAINGHSSPKTPIKTPIQTPSQSSEESASDSEKELV